MPAHSNRGIFDLHECCQFGFYVLLPKNPYCFSMPHAYNQRTITDYYSRFLLIAQKLYCNKVTRLIKVKKIYSYKYLLHLSNSHVIAVLLFYRLKSVIFLLSIFLKETYHIRIEILKVAIFCLLLFVFSQQAHQFRRPPEIPLHLFLLKKTSATNCLPSCPPPVSLSSSGDQSRECKQI